MKNFEAVFRRQGYTEAEWLSAAANITFPIHSLDSPGTSVKCRA